MSIVLHKHLHAKHDAMSKQQQQQHNVQPVGEERCCAARARHCTAANAAARRAAAPRRRRAARCARSALPCGGTMPSANTAETCSSGNGAASSRARTRSATSASARRPRAPAGGRTRARCGAAAAPPRRGRPARRGATGGARVAIDAIATRGFPNCGVAMTQLGDRARFCMHVSTVTFSFRGKFGDSIFTRARTRDGWERRRVAETRRTDRAGFDDDPAQQHS